MKLPKLVVVVLYVAVLVAIGLTVGHAWLSDERLTIAGAGAEGDDGSASCQLRVSQLGESQGATTGTSNEAVENLAERSVDESKWIQVFGRVVCGVDESPLISGSLNLSYSKAATQQVVHVVDGEFLARICLDWGSLDEVVLRTSGGGEWVVRERYSIDGLRWQGESIHWTVIVPSLAVISGLVCDAATGIGVVGALVEIRPLEAATFGARLLIATDERGRFSSEVFGDGEYRCQFKGLRARDAKYVLDADAKLGLLVPIGFVRLRSNDPCFLDDRVGDVTALWPVNELSVRISKGSVDAGSIYLSRLGRIRCRVIDATSKVPLGDVRLRVSFGSRFPAVMTDSTDGNGCVVFRGPAGSGMVHVSIVGGHWRLRGPYDLSIESGETREIEVEATSVPRKEVQSATALSSLSMRVCSAFDGWPVGGAVIECRGMRWTSNVDGTLLVPADDVAGTTIRVSHLNFEPLEFVVEASPRAEVRLLMKERRYGRVKVIGLEQIDRSDRVWSFCSWGLDEKSILAGSRVRMNLSEGVFSLPIRVADGVVGSGWLSIRGDYVAHVESALLNSDSTRDVLEESLSRKSMTVRRRNGDAVSGCTVACAPSGWPPHAFVDASTDQGAAQMFAVSDSAGRVDLALLASNGSVWVDFGEGWRSSFSYGLLVEVGSDIVVD